MLCSAMRGILCVDITRYSNAHNKEMLCQVRSELTRVLKRFEDDELLNFLNSKNASDARSD